MIKIKDLLDENCWKGYTQYGMKKKGKKLVPNCVPVDEALEEDSIPYWGDTITDKDIPGYTKVATRLASNIGPVRGKTIKKFSTPMGNLKVVATSETLKDKVTPGKPEIKNNGMLLTNLINTPEMHAEVVLLSPSQQSGQDSNVSAILYITFYKIGRAHV